MAFAIAAAALASAYLWTVIQPTLRLHRINVIYDSLKISANYTKTGQSIFGEKRVYEWDKGRSYSSSTTYVRQVDMNVTVTELRTSIEQAGFKYFEEPYLGSIFTELYFKSAKNEYIRLNVISKSLYDQFGHSGASKSNPNQGPSIVTIKVNLDDNNE